MCDAPDAIYASADGLRTVASGFLTPRIVGKPRGHEELIVLTDRYAAKILVVEPGQRLSVQYHARKTETLLCVDGDGWVELGSIDDLARRERTPFGPGQALHIAHGTVHTIEGRTKLTVFEVSTPELDDVVRVEDRYGRAPRAGGQG